MSTDSTELTFVRCPACRSLVPAVSTRCRMCGATLDAAAKPESFNEPRTAGRVRQRTMSQPDSELSTAAGSVRKDLAPQEAPAEAPAAEVPHDDPLSEYVQEVPADEPVAVASSPAPAAAPRAAPVASFLEATPATTLEDLEEEDADEYEEEEIPDEIPGASAAAFEGDDDEEDDQDEDLLASAPPVAEPPPPPPPPAPPVVEPVRESRPSKREQPQVNAKTVIDNEPPRAKPERQQPAPRRAEEKREAPAPQREAPRETQSEEKRPPAKQEKPRVQNEQPARSRVAVENHDGRLVGWLVSYDNPDGAAQELREGKFFVSGKSLKDNDLVLKDASVSSPHAVMKIVGGRVLVQDLMSEHGVFVKRRQTSNYSREEESTELGNGDWIRFGEVEFLVCLIAHVGDT